MTHEEILDLFFSQRYEHDLYEMMLNDRFFIIPGDGILNYFCEILSVPYSEYLTYIRTHHNIQAITSYNITQSSSFKSCEEELVRLLINDGNRGLTYADVGALFPDKVKKHNDTNFKKYGENQIKTASQLGLTFEYFGHWYLNCVCYIYNELDLEDRNAYMARALLRDPLYRQVMLDIQNESVDIVNYMSCLDKASTKLRRYDSVMHLTEICLKECAKEKIKTYKILDTKPDLAYLAKEESLKKRIKQNMGHSRDLLNAPYVECDIMMAATNSPNKLELYKGKFAHLHCFKKNGKIAPHKAILLLAIMRCVESGWITSNNIEPLGILIGEFADLTSVMPYDKSLFTPTIDNPFIHLCGDGFLKLTLSPAVNDTDTIARISQVRYATLDEELYELMCNKESRNALSKILVDTYFD